MKFRTTRKAVKETNNTILKVNYCGLQNLLRFEEPEAYTEGVYGWNADIYDFGNFVIVTGYRPFGNYENYRVVNEFEEKAIELQRELYGDWRAEQQAMAELVDDFISAINVNTAKNTVY